MTNWYVIRTATRQEAKAADSLNEAFRHVPGFETYLPVYVRWERLGRHKTRTKKLRPMLPSYMFARIPHGDFCAVEAVDGVSCVLRYTTPNGDRRPQGVESILIHELRLIEATGEFDEPDPAHAAPTLQAGQRIKVTAGQFTGLAGVLVKLKPNQRASVLIEMFGRSSPAELPVAQLSAA